MWIWNSGCLDWSDTGWDPYPSDMMKDALNCQYLVALCRVTHTTFSNVIQLKWRGLAGGIWNPDWSRLQEPSEEQVCWQRQSPLAEEPSWGSRLRGSGSLYQHTSLCKSHMLCFQGRQFCLCISGNYPSLITVHTYTGKSVLKVSPALNLQECAPTVRMVSGFG